MSTSTTPDGPDVILLVEDSPTQGARLKFELESENFPVYWVRDGHEALAALDTVKPFTVVTDVLMPGMDGFELCREIRAREPYKETPVIVVTALSEPDDIIRALEVGATHFLVKPINTALLVSMIRHLDLNRRMDRHPAADFAIQINFKGRVHHIRSDRFQILDLLFSTYENMVEKARVLDQTCRQLRRTEEELRNALAQKEVLLREIHHRIKNNFMVVSSMLQLEASLSGNPQVEVVVEKARDRLNAMAGIHQKLYGAGDVANINFNAYLSELAASLLDTYGHDPARRLRCEALHPLTLELEAAIPCALMASELITNALKHGLTRGEGVLRLGLTSDGPSVRLMVEDNGVGLPAGFSLAKSGSFGLQLVGMLAGQLKGALRIETPEGGGARFVVSFPARAACAGAAEAGGPAAQALE